MHLHSPPPKSISFFLIILCCGVVSSLKEEANVNAGLNDPVSPSPIRRRLKENPRPNLITIMTDEQSFRTLSAHRDYLLEHYPKEKVDLWGEDIFVNTPNIDSIAKEGAMMVNFYTAAPVCTPSRASFLTGMFPHSTGAYKNHEPMHSNMTTFANVLQDNGYLTSFVGKWHLDGEEKPGWNTHENGRSYGFAENQFRFNRGHWKFFEEDVENNVVKAYTWDGRHKVEGDFQQQYATDFLFDRGIEFIERASNNDDPFAIMLSIPDPHGPNNSRPPYDNMHSNKHFKLPQTAKHAYKMDPASPRYHELDDIGQPKGLNHRMDTFLKQFEDAKTSQWQTDMQQYFSMISCIDDNVGKLLDALKLSGAYDNTILVFTSDHGDMLLEHGMLDKGKPYQGSIGMPFLIQYPGKISPGKIIETPYSSIDFAPTILGLMGRDTTDLNAHGVDVSDELLSEDLKPSNQTKIILSADFVHSEWAMAMSKDYKLVIGKFGAPWLFDLNQDPDEIINYIDSNLHRAIKIQLQDALIQAIADGRIKWELELGAYLDTPSCIDSLDVIKLRDGRKKRCLDIGHTLDVGKCENWGDVRRYCPRTCNLCKDAEDSEGLLLLPNREAKTCKALEGSSWCIDFYKARVFCPQACAFAPPSSERPSAIPSSQPSSCPDDPSAYFLLKLTDSGFKIKKQCTWLQDQDDREKDEICSNTIGKNKLRPAREVCMNTCGTCNSMSPNQAPSPLPINPQPSPPSCHEDPDEHFFLKIGNNGFNIQKQCSWLRDLTDSEKDGICANTRGKGVLKPAREICPNTCGTCYQSCFDDPSEYFFLKNGENGFKIKKECSWLRDRPDNERGDICTNTIGKGTLRPAQEVCINTCGTCNMNQSPSMKPRHHPSPCSDDPHMHFYYGISKTGRTMRRTCSWLKTKTDSKNEICAITIGKGKLRPAREVCKKFCGSC